LFLLRTFKALNSLLCADVPLRNYSLTPELTAVIYVDSIFLYVMFYAACCAAFIEY